MQCPQPKCKMRGVPAGVRGHLVLVHGFSRTEADALTMAEPNDKYTSIGGRDMDGKDIQKARKAAGLTQKELADNIGVSDATIYGWEKDKWNPNEARAKQLREVLFDQPESRIQHEEDEPSEPVSNTPDSNSKSKCNDDCCHSFGKQCDESEDQHTEEKGISPSEQQKFFNMGYDAAVKQGMSQLKTRAQQKFWKGHTAAAVELRRLYSMLSSRINDSQSD